MKTGTGFLFAGVLISIGTQVHAQSTTPEKQIDTLMRLSGVRPKAVQGQEFFTNKHGREWSCSSCHTADPTVLGKHVKTGKVGQQSGAVDPVTVRAGTVNLAGQKRPRLGGPEKRHA